MNVLFIQGSARERSYSSALCVTVASSLRPETLRHAKLHEMYMEHCTGCGSCKDTKKCVFDDGMTNVLKMIEASDIIVFATPLHWSGPSSIMKQAVDRLQSIWNPRSNKKKTRAAGLICAAGSDAPVFSGTVSVFKAAAAAIDAAWAGELLISGTDRMTRLPDDTVEKAIRFAVALEDTYRAL